MAASVSSPTGKEDVRAKGQRQRRKWIPAQGRNDEQRRRSIPGEARLFQQARRGGGLSSRGRISPHLRRSAHQSLPGSGRNCLRLVRNQPAFARIRRPRGFGGFRYDGEADQFRSAPGEFPKNSINIDKFTGFFDKLMKINFVDFGAAGSRRREDSATARAARHDGKCGELRGWNIRATLRSGGRKPPRGRPDVAALRRPAAMAAHPPDAGRIVARY